MKTNVRTKKRKLGWDNPTKFMDLKNHSWFRRHGESSDSPRLRIKLSGRSYYCLGDDKPGHWDIVEEADCCPIDSHSWVIPVDVEINWHETKI